MPNRIDDELYLSAVIEIKGPKTGRLASEWSVDAKAKRITFKRSSEVYENGVLAHAIDRSLEIKCLRMRAFLTEHRNSLHLHIAQLRQFASSPGGKGCFEFLPSSDSHFPPGR